MSNLQFDILIFFPPIYLRVAAENSPICCLVEFCSLQRSVANSVRIAAFNFHLPFVPCPSDDLDTKSGQSCRHDITKC